MIYFDETSADELDAIREQRRDVDLEMAAMTAVGDRMAELRRAGVCTHGSAQGYREDLGDPELRPGQVRCTDTCGRIFASDDDWYAAIDAALRD
ncbi:hypothetical protein [Embleya sp. NBC_00896]|uniref:hypothetical protein n=1 Tax=Embleya sp. NBC_00896 TaxID=2975961 RepID=UPI002F91A51A|nr:hypothetical protein OG928_48615 [Embleya sp. NBC_00896]